MNDLNELETQLRSWAPRRPSPRLSLRIFNSTARKIDDSAPPGPAVQSGWRFGWLAPATAALVLLGVLANQRDGGSGFSGTNSSPLLALISSNQSAYLPVGYAIEQNTPPDTFEWTNRSGSTSSIRSLWRPRADY